MSAIATSQIYFDGIKGRKIPLNNFLQSINTSTQIISEETDWDDIDAGGLTLREKINELEESIPEEIQNEIPKSSEIKLSHSLVSQFSSLKNIGLVSVDDSIDAPIFNIASVLDSAVNDFKSNEISNQVLFSALSDKKNVVLTETSGQLRVFQNSLSVILRNPNSNLSHFLVSGKVVSVKESSLTLIANSDNYIELNKNGNYFVNSVGVGQPEPISYDSIKIWKVVTNTNSVVSNVDLRNFNLIGENSIKSIKSSAIADGSIASIKLQNVIGSGISISGVGKLYAISVNTKGQVTSFLDNTDISSPSNGQYLRYNQITGKWQNSSVAPGSIPSLSQGSLLTSDGTNLGGTSSLYSINNSMLFGEDLGSMVSDVFRIGVDKKIFTSCKQFTATSKPAASGSLPIGLYTYKVYFADGDNLVSAPFEIAPLNITTTGNKIVIEPDDIPLGSEKIIVMRSFNGGPYSHGIEVDLDSFSSATVEDTGSSFSLMSDYTDYQFTSQKIDSSALRLGISERVKDFVFSVKNRSITRPDAASILNKPIKSIGRVTALDIENVVVNYQGTTYTTALRLFSDGNPTVGNNIGLYIEKGKACIGGIDSLEHISTSFYNKPILPPKFTTAQLATLASQMNSQPDYQGAIAFNISTSKLQSFNGTNFVDV